MKYLMIVAFCFPWVLAAQPVIYIPDVAFSHLYTHMAFSDRQTVTLWSTSALAQSAFHTFRLTDGTLERIKKPVIPTFEVQTLLSTLPDTEEGGQVRHNMLFSATRRDSAFVIYARFDQRGELTRVLDVAYLADTSDPSRFAEVRGSVVLPHPATGEAHSFVTIVRESGLPAACFRAKILTNGRLSLSTISPAALEKLQLLRSVKDFIFTNDDYILTGEEVSSVTILLDSNLGLLNTGRPFRYDTFPPYMGYSMRDYTIRQLNDGRMIIIGDGIYSTGTSPVIVKPTINTIQINKKTIIFGQPNPLTITDRNTWRMEASYPKPGQSIIFLTGAEPEVFEEAVSDAYIYFKKIEDGEETRYTRFGGDRGYLPRGINVMVNGNIVIYGAVLQANRFESKGFVAFVSPDGEMVSTNVVDEQRQQPLIHPNPVTDRLFVKQASAEPVNNISIFDANGRLVSSFNNFSQEYLDVSALVNGLYVVKVQSGQQISLHKFVRM